MRLSDSSSMMPDRAISAKGARGWECKLIGWGGFVLELSVFQIGQDLAGALHRVARARMKSCEGGIQKMALYLTTNPLIIIT